MKVFAEVPRETPAPLGVGNYSSHEARPSAFGYCRAIDSAFQTWHDVDSCPSRPEHAVKRPPSQTQSGVDRARVMNAVELGYGTADDESAQTEGDLRDGSVSHMFGLVPKCDVTKFGALCRSRLSVRPSCLTPSESVRNSPGSSVSPRSVSFSGSFSPAPSGPGQVFFSSAFPVPGSRVSCLMAVWACRCVCRLPLVVLRVLVFLVMMRLSPGRQQSRRCVLLVCRVFRLEVTSSSVARSQ